MWPPAHKGCWSRARPRLQKDDRLGVCLGLCLPQSQSSERLPCGLCGVETCLLYPIGVPCVSVFGGPASCVHACGLVGSLCVCLSLLVGIAPSLVGLHGVRLSGVCVFVCMFLSVILLRVSSLEGHRCRKLA